MWEAASLLQPRPFLNKLSNALVSRKICERHREYKRFSAMGKCCENIFQIYILVAAFVKKIRRTTPKAALEGFSGIG
jgi:hypothetical protein